MLHTRSDNGRFGFKQGNCLSLHVGSHERTVGIVVFKERYKRSSDGYHLSWRNVYIIYFVTRNFRYVFSVAHKHTFVNEPAVFVKRLRSLRHSVSVFFVCSKVSYAFGSGNDSLVLFVHHTIRSFDKAVLVDASVRRKR